MVTMTTNRQVQKHIQDLINQDKDDKKQVNGFYDQALQAIKGAINAFFIRYAGDTGLDVNTLNQDASTWDKQQFEDAINLVMTGITPDDDLSKRLISLQYQAGLKRRDTLMSIIGATTAVATAKTQDYGNKVATRQYVKEYQHVSKRSAVKIPKKVQDNPDFNNQVWINNDLIVHRTQQALDDAIHTGIDKAGLNQLLKDNQDSTLVRNLDSASQAGVSFNKSATVDSSIKSTNTARDDAFSNSDVTHYVSWQTDHDDLVCDECAPLDDSVYEEDDPSKPIPEVDTHPNCRCIYVACDADGMLLDEI